ncbi:hypothetical protein U27_01442 [Candidatus Vecturithrix granuli]|uniref:Uncharacterized protein n=1 Tax=Vecturithrix granuli TaxID=1499967 RepID=A0A081CAD6_VECG1|nr:hypothetical protein U27_01442 [Candidatus Vecturithrix granuli]
MVRCYDARSSVKTLIKPWKGLKQKEERDKKIVELYCENPNKTLEGIKTLRYITTRGLSMCENPNKTLEGIKTCFCCESGF